MAKMLFDVADLFIFMIVIAGFSYDEPEASLLFHYVILQYCYLYHSIFEFKAVNLG